MILILSLVALILTKLADIVTTVRGIRRTSVQGERNPLARWGMLRWGLGGGITAIMLLWTAVVALTYYEAWHGPAWMQYAVAGMGFFVAWCQWEVAKHNATGKPTRFTRFMRNAYESINHWKRGR